MKKFLIAAAAALSFAAAHADPASEASVHALLALTHADSIVDEIFPAMDQAMRASMQQSFQGQQLTPKQQKLMESMPAKMVELVREEMAWSKMEPIYTQIYQESFDQSEVNGLVAFYRTPAGQAVINKQPIVMQKTMALVQLQMQSLVPKMMASLTEAMADAKGD